MLDVLQKVFIISFAFISGPYLTWAAIRELRQKHGKAVRTVWYFFSLATFASLLVICWATSNGAIDEHGSFQGTGGALINELFTAMLDLPTDFTVLTALVLLLIVPQLMGYILSSLFGCASRPLFIGSSMDFLVWGIMKSFAVTAGIFLSVELIGLWHGWPYVDLKFTLTVSFLSVLLLMISFGGLHTYFEAITVIKQICDRCPQRLIRLLMRYHDWATKFS